ncbi:hypothetical protein EDC05_006470, partial [Coemansia umbellata]
MEYSLSSNLILCANKKLFVKHKHEEKTILHNLSGGFRSGKVTAILGPSGSGKTTLLNLLSGYVTAGTTTGNIWVNGRPATGASMRLLAGYVNQDDVLNTKAGLKHKKTLRCANAIAQFGLDK